MLLLPPTHAKLVSLDLISWVDHHGGEGSVGRGAQIGPGSSRRLGWIPALPFTSWGTLVKPLTLELKGIWWGKRGILYRDEM